MSSPHAGGRPAPTSRPPLVTPSALALYRACPQRWYLAKKILYPADEEFSPALARGRAVHAVLAECAGAVQDGLPLPVDLPDRVARALLRAAYPDVRVWEEESRVTLAQVGAGLAHLRGGGRILAIERFHRWSYAGDATCPRFTLGAVADLVTADVDEEGREYATITDYKTSRRKAVDILQEVALRIVVRAALGDRYAYLVSTTVHLVDGTATSGVRDDATCREVWRSAIKGTVEAMLADRAWIPVADTHCGWCPFAGNGCALDHPGMGRDRTADWLEGEDLAV